jgi:osmotically-inducible protein OsmY
MKTDIQLRTDVEAELKWDPSLDDRGIVVAAKDGIVTLAGTVPSYSDRWAAEKATKGISGVRAIANDIEVKPISTRTDQEIAAAAVNALKAHVSVPASDLKVIVSGGWLTLEGKAALWYQKNAAETAVRSLWGVKGISNNIQIQPPADAGDIRGKIHEAFKRHADLDAGKVNVSVLDGTVTLTGEVHSWHEREDAERAAWAAPGVSRVKNDLSMAV